MGSLSKIVTVSLLLLAASSSYAQRGRDNTGGEVLMLEEIKIEVAPELPTVVVTIPRQRPEIAPVVLTKNPEDLISGNTASIKPRLTDMLVNRLEEPEKILAKKRAQ